MSKVKKFDKEWKALVAALSVKDKFHFDYLVTWDPSKLSSLEKREEDASALLTKVSNDIEMKGDEPSKGIISLINFLYPDTAAAEPSESMYSKPKTALGGSTDPSGSTLDCPTPLTDIKITFDDIAGNNQVKDQMKAGYIFPFIFRGLFPSLAKGVLLYGPPGTGKTMMAKAATREIPNSLFYGPSPAELKGKYLGDTEKNIHKVFECAEKTAKETESKRKAKGDKIISIIFFDEFDSIGKDRQDGEGMAASVNTLLQEMDGIKARPSVSVLAATNYPGSLDSAIKRRFPVRIFVDLPDSEAIEFKIREALANAYTPPGEGIRNTDGSVAVREFYDPSIQDKFPSRKGNYMDAIKTYGGFEAKSVKGFFGGDSVLDSYVDNSYIEELVKKFGPTVDGTSFLEEWRSGKVLPCSDSRIQKVEPIFGYSPSDIDQIMSLAIKNCALRALGLHTEKKPFSGETYWVANPGVTKGAKGYQVQEKAKVIAFDIRRSDIESAFKQNGSTIRNKEYYNLVHFAKFGDVGC